LALEMATIPGEPNRLVDLARDPVQPHRRLVGPADLLLTVGQIDAAPVKVPFQNDPGPELRVPAP
jgi:hypothetical protein